MADKKKPKIDLKSRLRKQTVSSPTGSSIPPPAVGKGIPAPPFGRPKVDASNPYAAVEAEQAAKAKPQAFRVEMSQEVVEAQKKGRSKVIAGAFAAALVGAGVGFAIGSGHERNKVADVALGGAKELASKVDDATAKAEQLADVLASARQKIAASKFPDAEVSRLGGLRVPFEGADLAGKGIGRFKANMVTMLLTYTAKADAANEQKDRVQRVLGGSKKAIQEFLSQKENPKVRWSVFVGYGPNGPWGTMQPLPEPFLVRSDEKKDGKKYEWPEEFTIKEGKTEHKLKRYTKGNPMGTKPLLIPIDPESQSQVCPADTMFKIARELSKLEALLRGKKMAGGDREEGLIHLGASIVEELKKIGQPQ